MEHSRQAEPVTALPPRRVWVPTMRQRWSDAIFLHWEIDRDAAAQWLPPRTRLDLLDGSTYVGLIGLQIDVALLGAIAVPYLGSFAEVNVRLYSVDRQGRRGIVFCSLDADRLVPALAGVAGFGLPYRWSQVRRERHGRVTRYSVRRQWPGPRPATTEFAVRTGELMQSPSEADIFLTARWSLHWRRGPLSLWAPAAHPPWPLYRAEVVTLDDSLVEAASLPPVTGAPVSALWSPGTTARIGAPRPISGEP